MLALLLDLGWKSALIAGVTLLANRAMRGRPAGERVFLLRVSIAMLLALPAAAALLPALDLAVLPPLASPPPDGPVPASAAVLPVSAPAVHADLDAAVFAVALYFAGTAALLLHLGAGIVTLARWTRRGTPVADPKWQAALHDAALGLRRPVQLLESRDVATPLSWGGSSAWILIDPDSLARREQAAAVLAHEMAHVRRLDWPMLVVARIAVALFWCNPLVWLVARTLVRESEIAADEAAVLRVARLDYAQALLAFAKAPAGHRAATGMALWPSALKERIARIVEAKAHPRRNRMLLGAMLVCGVGATPTLAALQFVHAAHGDQERPVSPAATPNSQVLATLGAAPVAEVNAGDPVPAPSAASQPAASIVTPSPQASPMPTGVVAPAAVAVPATVSAPVTRIVGRTGATVIQGPGGTTIIGAPDGPATQDQEAAEERLERQREAEEGAIEARLGRRDAARELRAGAADLRRQAEVFERTANDPSQPEALRRGHAEGARSLRSGAANMEAQAAGLENG
ncbi:M56 family metallopeptidase [Sphingomonas sp. DT-207]|uniref:M56 family metallopeptidase n=1 Tax=Sphingomonas sp. DT-207 TaxID=3396167 RepID=UPI003F1C8FF9